jgi:hypothetical protein
MRIALLLAALSLAGCEAARGPIEVARCDRSMEGESYQGPCWARETFERSREGGGEG